MQAFALIMLVAALSAPASHRKIELSNPALVFAQNSFGSLQWVDGVKYTSLSACYADIPASGGVCMVPPNYSETLAGNIVCDKSYSGFVFTGPASIVAGSNQFIVPAGTSSCFIDSWVPFGSAVLQNPSGLEWNYTGNGAAFLVGSSAKDTLGFRIKDIAIFLNNAGSTAVGLDVIRTTFCEIKNLHIIGPTGAVAQQGIILDGTGNYTGCKVDEAIIAGVLKGIQLTGSGVYAGNASKIIGGQISSPASGASIGIDFEAGSGGNVVLGTDVEDMSIGYNFGGASTGNYVIARSEANTIGATFSTGTTSNEVHLLNTVNPCVQGGSNNVCTNVPTVLGTKATGAGHTFTQACSGVARSSARLALQWVGGRCSSAATAVQMPVPTDGTISNLRVRCGRAGRTPKSGEFFLRKNGTVTSLRCTVGTGRTCNDTSDSVPVVAGDTLQIGFSTQAAETLANCAASFEKH